MLDVSTTHKPVRVLHVIGKMDRAGAETIIMNLLRTVDKSRVVFDFVVHTHEPGDYDDEIRSHGCRIFVAPAYKIYNYVQYRHWWDRFFRAHNEFNIVHGHIASCARVYLAAAKRAGIPTIAHSHSTDGKVRTIDLSYYVFRALTVGTARVADYLMGCSPEAIQARYGKGGLSRPETMVVLNGVDLTKFHRDEKKGFQLRQELSIPDNAPVIGTVGRLTAVKNPDFFLDVVSKLLPRFPDMHILWSGRGDLEDHIKSRISLEGLASNVHLLGLRNDVDTVMNALDCFLLCSKYEGLPLVLIEAQASGVPVLASKGVPSSSFVTPRCRRLGIAPEDVSMWADAVEGELRQGRYDGTPYIEDTGFNIHHTANELTEFYSRHSCKNVNSLN